jgi:hypothetical protein
MSSTQISYQKRLLVNMFCTRHREVCTFREIPGRPKQPLSSSNDQGAAVYACESRLTANGEACRSCGQLHDHGQKQAIQTQITLSLALTLSMDVSQPHCQTHTHTLSGSQAWIHLINPVLIAVRSTSFSSLNKRAPEVACH